MSCRGLPEVWILVLLDGRSKTKAQSYYDLQPKPTDWCIRGEQTWSLISDPMSDVTEARATEGFRSFDEFCDRDVWTKVHGMEINDSTWRDEDREELWDSLLCFTP